MQVAFKVADRIVMLNAGKIAGAGSPAYFRDLSVRPTTAAMSESELMIRQFVRGEAVGPIHAVQ
jgi:ABC-type sulfate/molybdate transport systems ATPase subunit